MKRPKNDSHEGKTPAIGDHQARALLAAPNASTVSGLRDHAMLDTLLYHGLRRAELCALRLVDLQDRRGVRHLQVHGKVNKIRYVPLHPPAASAITAYLEATGHGVDEKVSPLFRPVSNNARGARAITPDGAYKVLAKYAILAHIMSMALAPMRCALQPLPTRLNTTPISLRCNSG